MNSEGPEKQESKGCARVCLLNWERADTFAVCFEVVFKPVDCCFLGEKRRFNATCPISTKMRALK